MAISADFNIATCHQLSDGGVIFSVAHTDRKCQKAVLQCTTLSVCWTVHSVTRFITVWTQFPSYWLGISL